MSVVIVVRGGDAHAVTRPLQACGGRHVRESAVAVVAVQAVPEARVGFVGLRAFRHRIGKRGPVDQEYVEQAVVVVVEHRYTAAHGLHQILARGRAGLMRELHFGSLGDIGKELGWGCGLRALKKGY